MHLRDHRLLFDFIRRNQYLFVLWVVSAVGLGLIGLWFPLFVLPSEHFGVGEVFQQIVRAGVLPSFGVVFASSAIAEALAGSKANCDGDTQVMLTQLRAITVVVCLAVMLAQAGLLSRSLSGDSSPSNWILQIILVVASLAVGCYLYCFRCVFSDPVDSRVNEMDSEAGQVRKDSAAADKDDWGAKL